MVTSRCLLFVESEKVVTTDCFKREGKFSLFRSSFLASLEVFLQRFRAKREIFPSSPSKRFLSFRVHRGSHSERSEETKAVLSLPTSYKFPRLARNDTSLFLKGFLTSYYAELGKLRRHFLV